MQNYGTHYTTLRHLRPPKAFWIILLVFTLLYFFHLLVILSWWGFDGREEKKCSRLLEDYGKSAHTTSAQTWIQFYSEWKLIVRLSTKPEQSTHIVLPKVSWCGSHCLRLFFQSSNNGIHSTHAFTYLPAERSYSIYRYLNICCFGFICAMSSYYLTIHLNVPEYTCKIQAGASHQTHTDARRKNGIFKASRRIP